MSERSPECPSCKQAGAAVGRITLKALLTADGLRRGVPARPRYCDNAECPIVYFDADSEATFTEADLTVRVHAKHPNEAGTLVCYCFGVTVGAMANGDGARMLRESVAREVKAQHCACEVRNPKGGCCLGDLVRLERGRQSAMTTSCCTPQGE